MPGLAGVLREGCLFYKSWVQRWIGGISVTAKILNDVPFPGKETKENRKKKKKKKDRCHCLAEAVCQGFAGENYARRASFSRGKRRSRLTLTGRRRQATFAVFLFWEFEDNSTFILLKLIPDGIKEIPSRFHAYNMEAN